jgi:acetyltransferase
LASAERSTPDRRVRWQRCVRTRDGADYRIRPIRTDDVERDRDFIAGLSELSRYRRMMGSMHAASPSLLDRLVHVDYRRSMAFVAVVDDPAHERIIGVARYAAGTEGDEAEFAVAVSDAWQSRGVATHLLFLLADYAREQGLAVLWGTILADNAPMLRLARGLGMAMRGSPHDGALVEARWNLFSNSEHT